MRLKAGALVLTIGAVCNLSTGWDPVHITTTLSEPRGYLAATTVGHFAMFAGGVHYGNSSSVVDIYDAASDAWSTAALSQPRGYLSATTVGTKAIFAGGGSDSWDSAAVDIYDATTGQWSQAWLSRPARSPAAVTLGDKAMFASHDVVDIYDAAAGTWSTAPLSVNRKQIAGTVVGSKAIFAGGWLSPGVPSDAVDIYDSATDTWSTARLYQERFYIAAVTIGNTAMFVGGQVDSQGAHTSNIIDVYDAETDAWSVRTMPQGRSGSQWARLGDRIYFPRYFPDAYFVDVYEIASEQWHTADYWPGRQHLAATSVGDMALFAGGGYWPASDRVDILVVPEPATLSLLGLGGLALVRRRRGM